MRRISWRRWDVSDRAGWKTGRAGKYGGNAENLEKTSAKNRGNAGTQDSGPAADRHNYDTVEISRSPSRTSGSMSAADDVPERPDAGNSAAFHKASSSSPAAAQNTAFLLLYFWKFPIII